MQGDLSVFWQVAVALVMAGAVYGGIRQDLKAMHEELRGHKKSIRRLHKRLNSIRDERRNNDD